MMGLFTRLAARLGRRRVDESASAPTADDVAAAARLLSQHRARAHHDHVIAKAREIRAELGMTDAVRVRG